MNRDIKFRCKDFFDKRWVYGNYFMAKHDTHWMVDLDFTFQPVLLSTIGQFTGLRDKNGAEIYEGDILSIKHPFMGREHVGTVIYEDYMFNIEGFSMSHFDYPNIAFSEGTQYMEVIGNIHENTELIK